MEENGKLIDTILSILIILGVWKAAEIWVWLINNY